MIIFPDPVSPYLFDIVEGFSQREMPFHRQNYHIQLDKNYFRIRNIGRDIINMYILIDTKENSLLSPFPLHFLLVQFSQSLE